MIKVMIVDDEVLVRVGIKSLVDWENYNYTIVADASNGKEALEKIALYQPEIVLTDLMMDTMDGFELIETCESRGMAIKFIVLSNYNDFDNVKKAMKIGAFDYVFKLTVKPDELLKIMDEAYKDNKKPQQENAVTPLDVVQKNIGVIKKNLVHKILDSNYYMLSSLQNELNSIPFRINFNRQFCSLYLVADNLKIARKNGNFQDLGLLVFTMENIISEVFDGIESSEVILLNECDFLVTLNFEGDYQELIKIVTKEFDLLVKYIKQYIGLDISGALSKYHKGVTQLRDAVQENITLIEKRFFYESNRIYLLKEYQKKKITYSFDVRFNEIKTSVAGRHYDRLYKIIHTILDELNLGDDYQPQDILEILRRMLKQLYFSFSLHSVDINSILNKDGVNLQEAIEGYDFYEMIRKNTLQFIKLYIDECQESNGKPCRKEINQVKSFIHNHLKEDLSVSKLASMISMSESRFSHVFKDEVGINFIEYVNQAREKEAMELLKSTDMKIAEIADTVGIDNPNYFSAQFKKRTGMSPNNFRRMVWHSRK